MTTRRTYRTGSIEDRGNGAYRLRVLFPDPGTGRLLRRSKTVHAPARGSKRFLENEMAKFRTEVAEMAMAGSKATLNRLLDEWVATLGAHLAAKTREGYVARVENQLRPGLGDVRLDQLTVHRIERFYARLADEGLAPRTVQLVHAVLRSALVQGVAWGWLPDSILRVRRPKLPKEEHGAPLTVDQVSALYAAATDPPLKCAIGLAVATGLRRGELVGLKWSDITDGVARISRAWVPDDHGQHLSPTKGGYARQLILGGVGETVLERYRTIQEETWGSELGEWILSDGDGTDPLQARVLTTGFAVVARSLDIKATFHDLRHFHQSLQVASGIDVVTAARRAGHTPEVMLAVYAHGTNEQDVRAAELVSAALGEVIALEPPK